MTYKDQEMCRNGYGKTMRVVPAMKSMPATVCFLLEHCHILFRMALYRHGGGPSPEIAQHIAEDVRAWAKHQVNQH